MKRYGLREWRKRKGLTQEQLAMRSGVEQAVISKIERAAVENPRFETVRRLADGLGIDPRSIAFGHLDGSDQVPA